MQDALLKRIFPLLLVSMSAGGSGIDRIRKRVSEIDSSILALLDERTDAVRAIGAEKLRQNQGVFVPGLEDKKIALLCANARSFPKKGVERVFREIIGASRALQRKQRIGFLGPKGSYSHEAALDRFGSADELVEFSEISGIFSAVERNSIDIGIIPLENSLEGSVSHSLDLLVSSAPKIVAEHFLCINHCLLSNTPRSCIKKVYSHPQALAQCKKWLDANLPGAEKVASSSTSRAAEVAAGEQGSGAIAPKACSSLYGIGVQEEGIQDSFDNTTRFAVIGFLEPGRSGSEKTSVVFSVKNSPGALFGALEAFKKFGVNMTKLESRPSKQNRWEYMFFVDIEGFVEDDSVRSSLSELENQCTAVKVLGSYPGGGSFA